ncbi:host cell division inhibitor Icd-like protein [Rahnella inusitata]|uniref:host cell division inhibitor Icd-like protein n=1 Tax=Rahnella inusitata TaxID=58169 RepID=UPI0039AF5CC3
MSRLIVDMYVPTKLALHQSGTYPNILKPEKETPLKGITSTRQGLTTTVNTSNEVAVMDITTHPQGRDSLTPNKFTWRFLALSANSSHVIRIVANTEREARDQSPAGCVMVFAGRLPVEEVSYVA